MPQRVIGWVMQWPNVEPPSLTYSVICAKGTSRHRERSRCCCAGSATSLGQWPPALGRAEPQAQQLQKCLFVCIWCLLQVLFCFTRSQLLRVIPCVFIAHDRHSVCKWHLQLLCSSWPDLCACACVHPTAEAALLKQRAKWYFSHSPKRLMTIFFYSFSSLQSTMQNKNK